MVSLTKRFVPKYDTHSFVLNNLIVLCTWSIYKKSERESAVKLYAFTGPYCFRMYAQSSQIINKVTLEMFKKLLNLCRGLFMNTVDLNNFSKFRTKELKTKTIS